MHTACERINSLYCRKANFNLDEIACERDGTEATYCDKGRLWCKIKNENCHYDDILDTVSPCSTYTKGTAYLVPNPYYVSKKKCASKQKNILRQNLSLIIVDNAFYDEIKLRKEEAKREKKLRNPPRNKWYVLFPEETKRRFDNRCTSQSLLRSRHSAYSQTRLQRLVEEEEDYDYDECEVVSEVKKPTPPPRCVQREVKQRECSEPRPCRNSAYSQRPLQRLAEEEDDDAECEVEEISKLKKPTPPPRCVQLEVKQRECSEPRPCLPKKPECKKSNVIVNRACPEVCKKPIRKPCPSRSSIKPTVRKPECCKKVKPSCPQDTEKRSNKCCSKPIPKPKPIAKPNSPCCAKNPEIEPACPEDIDIELSYHSNSNDGSDKSSNNSCSEPIERPSCEPKNKCDCTQTSMENLIANPRYPTVSSFEIKGKR